MLMRPTIVASNQNAIHQGPYNYGPTGSTYFANTVFPSNVQNGYPPQTQANERAHIQPRTMRDAIIKENFPVVLSLIVALWFLTLGGAMLGCQIYMIKNLSTNSNYASGIWGGSMVIATSLVIILTGIYS